MTTDLAQSVIHLLQDQQGFITSNELARKLQVSYKTIQRVVSRINSGYGSTGGKTEGAAKKVATRSTFQIESRSVSRRLLRQ